jgi:hypothetical protein
MSRKNYSNLELKAIKALLAPEDIKRAKELAAENGVKLQSYYGNAIIKAVREGFNGTRN